MTKPKLQRKRPTPFAITLAEQLVAMRKYNDYTIARIINQMSVNNTLIHIPVTRVRRIRVGMGLSSIAKNVKRPKAKSRLRRANQKGKSLANIASSFREMPASEKYRALEGLLEIKAQLSKSFEKAKGETARKSLKLKSDELDFLIEELCSVLPEAVLRQFDLRV